jgi:hypothetical protein
MTESARLPHRRCRATSVGKSAGQARIEIDVIGAGAADASSSSALDVARTTDARTSATSATSASSSSTTAGACMTCGPPT